MKSPEILSRKAKEYLSDIANIRHWILPQSCFDQISEIAKREGGFEGSESRPMRISDFLDFDSIISAEGEFFEHVFAQPEAPAGFEDIFKDIPPNVSEHKTNEALEHLRFRRIYKNFLFDLHNHRQFTDEEISLLIMEAFDKERKKFEKLKAKFSGVEIERKRVRIPESVRIGVWQRDGGRCVECGSNEKLEYDHIIPFSRGGSNTTRNIQLLCESCNRSKGASL